MGGLVLRLTCRGEAAYHARGLATVTVLYPVDLDTAGRVALLADSLAA